MTLFQVVKLQNRILIHVIRKSLILQRIFLSF